VILPSAGKLDRMDNEIALKIRFALAEGFGVDFARSELADELCAFGER
jgi:hypothetical protein